MSSTDIKRPNFYEGQYLGAQDLTAAQDYQRQQDQRHRLAEHTWGIAVGMDLEERPKPGSGGAVHVYVKPGYAVDGFGRAMAVLEPYKLSEALFAQFTFDQGPPDGQWIPVWLRYREEKANPPRPGYAVCDVEDQAYRVRESFRVVVGELPLASQQRDPISVAGKLVDAQSQIPDASVPYQALPDSVDASRWLIRLGSVRWLAPNPPATPVGHFVESKTDMEKLKARDGRPYVGVVAAEILAPASNLMVKDRFTDPLPTDPNDPRFGGVAVTLEGSLDVVRDAHVAGRVGVGTKNPTGRLTLTGMVQPQQGALTLFAPDADFVYDGGDDKLFLFKDTGGKTAFVGGNVGIGSTAPVSKLQVGGDLALEAIPTGAARVLPPKSTMLWNDGYWLRLNQNLDFSKPIFGVHTPGVLAPGSLNVGGAASWGDPGAGNAWITGNVGIGTANPTRKLEVVGDVQVTNGNIFVGNTMIPIHTPVDVVVGVRRFFTPPLVGVGGGFKSGTDLVYVTSRLQNVSKATAMVALSDVSNFSVATNARWSVQVGTINVFNNASGSGAFIGVDWRVDDDGEIVCYQFVVVFEP